jgi:hypothetical protein
MSSCSLINAPAHRIRFCGITHSMSVDNVGTAAYFVPSAPRTQLDQAIADAAPTGSPTTRICVPLRPCVMHKAAHYFMGMY